MKKRLLYIAAISMTMLISACGESEKGQTSVNKMESSASAQIMLQETDAIPTTEDDKGDDKGKNSVSADASLNGIGNITNSDGYAVTDGEWIYFRGNKKNNYYSLLKMSMDGSEIDVVRENVNPWYLNLEDGWFYYSNHNSKLCKLSVEGSELQELSEYTCQDIVVSDGWIYYSLRDDRAKEKGLYKMKTDGSSNTLLYQSSYVDYLQVDGDWIYFESDSKFNRMHTDGTQLETIADQDISSGYIVSEDTVYNGLEKYQIGGAEKTEFRVYEYMSLLGDTIYYSDSAGICKINADGTGQEVIVEGEDLSHVQALGDWVFYINEGNSKWYFARTDGSDVRVAEK